MWATCARAARGVESVDMPGDVDVANAKRALRVEHLRRRAARPAAEREASANWLSAAVLASGNCLQGSVFAAYVPVGDEPGHPSILDALVQVGARVLLPITRGLRDPLEWGWYDGPDSLMTGPIGLLQPAVAEPGAGVGLATWAAVPALAVDRKGFRLGRGAGHYDRALAGIAPDRLIGIVYADEVVDTLPAEYHDRPVGWIITGQDGLQRLPRP